LGLPEDLPVYGEQREMMGTIWEVQIVLHGGERSKAQQAVADVFAELARIDQVMSEWRPDSPISALNASAGGPPVELPQELVDMIRRSIEFGRLSGGAFDITWHGMAGLWHFDEQFHVPSQAEVEAALKSVDYRRIRIEGRAVAIPAGFSLGLGGIAKGYAIDRAGSVIRSAGFPDFLVNGGGDVLTGGSRGNRPWRVGVRAPRGGPADLMARVDVSDEAIVTSGDYERYRIVDGVRYHHIIDPRNGWPASLCQSVTVVAPSAEQADALATAVFVLGPEKGLALVAGQDRVDVLVVDAAGKYVMTDGFRAKADFAEGG